MQAVLRWETIGRISLLLARQTLKHEFLDPSNEYISTSNIQCVWNGYSLLINHTTCEVIKQGKDGACLVPIFSTSLHSTGTVHTLLIPRRCPFGLAHAPLSLYRRLIFFLCIGSHHIGMSIITVFFRHSPLQDTRQYDREMNNETPSTIFMRDQNINTNQGEKASSMLQLHAVRAVVAIFHCLSN